MEETGYLTLIMNFLAPFLLGVAIAYLMFSTRRHQQDPVAQERANHATQELYKKEEREREAIEEPQPTSEPPRKGYEDDRRRRMSAS